MSNSCYPIKVGGPGKVTPPPPPSRVTSSIQSRDPGAAVYGSHSAHGAKPLETSGDNLATLTEPLPVPDQMER